MSSKILIFVLFNFRSAPMADSSDDANHIEKLYEFGERLNESKDKSQVIFIAFDLTNSSTSMASFLLPRLIFP